MSFQCKKFVVFRSLKKETAPTIESHFSHRLGIFLVIDYIERHSHSSPVGITINSELISDNDVYVGHLSQFLAPAVGEPSEWVLCYRASAHGWAVNTFHSRCDGKNNTITIIKNGQYVFGGYTDIPWGNFFVQFNSLPEIMLSELFTQGYIYSPLV